MGTKVISPLEYSRVVVSFGKISILGNKRNSRTLTLGFFVR